MIQDLEQLDAAAPIECDVCVIGTGAAGLAIANELLDTNLRLVFLEGGGADHEPASQDLYQSVITGHPFAGHMTGRFRVLGGSTTRWGGQALRLTPIDFQPRDWVPHSGWPIRYDQLHDYYLRASRFLEVDELDFDRDLFRLLGTQPPGFDAARVHYHFSKWSPRPDLRLAHRAKLAASTRATLLLHANVTRIRLSGDHRHVDEVTVRSLGGRSATVRAKQFVLCAGGIETARILLANNTQQPAGIGNGRDLVGRFFQDHPGAQIGVLRATNPNDAQRLFHLFYRAGLKYSVRFSATEQLQREQRILNISGLIGFDTGPGSAYDAAKEVYGMLRRREIGAALARKALFALSRAPSLFRPIYHYYIRRRGYSPDPVFRVLGTCEQEPHPDSRITLVTETDALGIPRSQIHWRLTDAVHRTFCAYARTLKTEFARAGIGEIELQEWTDEGYTDWRPHIGDQLHHMGTTRMHESPEYGVVDADCRVHGMDNLSIGSSAVFPTSGHSNPTLTLIALSIRIADRLRKELGVAPYP